MHQSPICPIGERITASLSDNLPQFIHGTYAVGPGSKELQQFSRFAITNILEDPSGPEIEAAIVMALSDGDLQRIVEIYSHIQKTHAHFLLALGDSDQDILLTADFMGDLHTILITIHSPATHFDPSLN